MSDNPLSDHHLSAHPFSEDWPRLREIAESQGVAGVIASIEAEVDPVQRRGLYSIAVQKLSHQSWPDSSLDNTIGIARAAIEEGIRQAKTESDQNEAARRIEYANVLSYNLSADLAICWPNDDRPRESRHFEAGLSAAEDCLRWRKELKKGAFPFSIAWWAHGIHALSLGRCEVAIESFSKSLIKAKVVAEEEGRSTEFGADANFSVNLATGYLGLARWRQGEDGGEKEFLAAIDAFRSQGLRHLDEQQETEFGVAQLETAASRIVSNSLQ